MKTPEELKQLIDEETEASELTRDEPLSERAVRRNRTEVYSVRLTPDEADQIRHAAESTGVTASWLVRAWVKQGLADECEMDKSVQSTVERLVRDVDHLKRQLADR